MAKGEVLGVCAICSKEIKSRWGAIQKDGLWVCAFRCANKYDKEKKAWSPEKWDELRRRQAEYARPVQAGEASLEELPDKVKAAIGDKKVISFVTGFGLIKKLTATIIVTEDDIVFYDPKITGANKTEIPFAQIVSATYMLQMGVPSFSVTTQSGTTQLMLSGAEKETREAALNLFNILKDKLSELAAVPISETHDKGLMKETWSFYAPPQLAVMGAKTESKITESIPDQIKKLAELRDVGILTSEEFEDKKKELLARL